MNWWWCQGGEATEPVPPQANAITGVVLKHGEHFQKMGCGWNLFWPSGAPLGWWRKNIRSEEACKNADGRSDCDSTTKYVAIPTDISVTLLWYKHNKISSHSNSARRNEQYRERKGEVLFLDLRQIANRLKENSLSFLQTNSDNIAKDIPQLKSFDGGFWKRAEYSYLLP